MHCTNCGAAVPVDAKFCAKCGTAIAGNQAAAGTKAEKPKPTGKEQVQGCAVLLVIVVILAALLGMCSGKSEEDVTADAAATAEDRRKGFHCLSGWDGSHREVVDQVKEQLRDPSSFEHDGTRITPVKNRKHTLIMNYRARNGFGGMNVATAMASVDNATCDATLVANE